MAKRRGYIPVGISRRLDHLTPHFHERKMALVLAHPLGGALSCVSRDCLRCELSRRA